MAQSYRLRRWSNAVFALPYLAVFLALLVFPLFWSLWLSLSEADPSGGTIFAGLRNFQRLFEDAAFQQALVNTVIFVAVLVPGLIALGLLLALALFGAKRGGAFLGGVFFASSVLSVSVVTLVWRLAFLPENGLVAHLADAFGSQQIGYLSTSGWSLFAVGVATLWWGIGLPVALFLIALKQTPRELFEAAALDNASRRQVLTRILLPAIKPAVLPVALIETILQLQLFGQAQLLTGGGPAGSSRPILLYVHQTAFVGWQVGKGAAAAEILFLLVLAAAIIQYALTSHRRES
jgi:multiple sugar transport system permease protein